MTQHPHSQSIGDLLSAADPVPESQARFDELLAALEGEPLESTAVEISVGEVAATVTFTEVRGHEWSHIAAHPPRLGHSGDAQMGCHTEHLLRHYPVDRIVCAGVHPTEGEWARLCELIDDDARTDIVVALWWMHVERYRQARAEIEFVQAARATKSKGEEHE